MYNIFHRPCSLPILWLTWKITKQSGHWPKRITSEPSKQRDALPNWKLRFLAGNGSFLIHRTAPWHGLGLILFLSFHWPRQSPAAVVFDDGWTYVRWLQALALQQAQFALYSSSIMFGFWWSGQSALHVGGGVCKQLARNWSGCVPHMGSLCTNTNNNVYHEIVPQYHINISPNYSNK